MDTIISTLLKRPPYAFDRPQKEQIWDVYLRYPHSIYNAVQYVFFGSTTPMNGTATVGDVGPFVFTRVRLLL